MPSGSIVKRLSVIAVIIAVAIFVYGLIDASGYRDGYVNGYGTASRLADAACMNGLVLDDDLCEKADIAVHRQGIDMSMGLAQVSAILTDEKTKSLQNDASAAAAVVRRTVRAKAKKKTIKKQVQSAATSLDTTASDQTTTNQSVGVDAQTVPVEQTQLPPPPPPLSAATQKILDRIKDAQGLSATYCSQYGTNRTACAEANFKCSMVGGVCAFTPLITGFRSIATDQIDQYVPCLIPEIVNGVIGVAKQVQKWCVATSGSSQMALPSNPSDIRTTGEMARSKEFRDALTASGVSASTATTPLPTAAPVLPSCMSLMGTNTPMIMGTTCTADMSPGMMMGSSCPSNRWNSQGVCISAAYTPSTLAQLLDIIIGLFNR